MDGEPPSLPPAVALLIPPTSLCPLLLRPFPRCTSLILSFYLCSSHIPSLPSIPPWSLPFILLSFPPSLTTFLPTSLAPCRSTSLLPFLSPLLCLPHHLCLRSRHPACLILPSDLLPPPLPSKGLPLAPKVTMLSDPSARLTSSTRPL